MFKAYTRACCDAFGQTWWLVSTFVLMALMGIIFLSCRGIEAAGPDLGVSYSAHIVQEALVEQKVLAWKRLASSLESDAEQRPDADRLKTMEELLGQIRQGLQAELENPEYRKIDFSGVQEKVKKVEDLLKAQNSSFAQGESDDTSRVQFGLQVDGLSDLIHNDQSIFFDLIHPFAFDFIAPHPRALGASMAIMNPAPGKYNFNKWIHASEVLKKHGYSMRVLIDDSGFHGMPDYWLKKATDEVTWINTSGHSRDRSGAHSALNIFNPQVVTWVTQYARNLATTLQSKSNIAVYEILNEPELLLGNQPVGYGQKAVQAFQQYLKNYYGQVAALNNMWGTDYTAFSEARPVDDILPRNDQNHTAKIYDFNKFRQEAYRNYTKKVIAALKQSDPDVPVCSQFFERIKSKSTFSGQPPLGRGIDFYSMAGLDWDILGNHNWPYNNEAIDLLYTYSVNRYLGHQLWDDEFIWTAWEGFDVGTPGIEEYYRTDPVILRNVLKRNIWRHLVWNHTGLIFFNLDRTWRGWDNSLLNLKGRPLAMRYCAGVIPTIKDKVERFGPRLYSSKIKDQGIYVLHSNLSEMLSFPFQKHVQTTKSTVEQLLSHNIVPFIFPEGVLRDVSDSECQMRMQACTHMIMPYTTHLSEKTCQVILDWVQCGGEIFLLGPAGLFNEHGQEIQGIFAPIFTERPTFQAETGCWGLSKKYRPGMEMDFGKGRVHYWSCHDVQEALTNLPELLQDCVLYSTDQESFRIVPKVSAEKEDLLAVTNIDPEFSKQGRIYIKEKIDKVQDLEFQNQALALKSTGGQTSFTLKLPPGDGSLYLLQKSPQ